MNSAVAQIGPPPVPVQRASPAGGLPRPWEAGLEPTPYSVANLYNGNLLTEIPITEVGTLGPVLRITLYHNSAAAAEGEPIVSPTGFSLGAGWSVSFGGACLDNGDDTVTVLEDDGNPYTFELDGGAYEPPAGVHDRLTWDGGASEWTLTRPDLFRRVFDEEGRLLRLVDAAGQYAEVERDAQNGHRITQVTGALEIAELGDEHVEFEYDPNGLLERLTDPNECAWEFEYDGENRLARVNFPNCGTTIDWVDFTYDASDRIVVIEENGGNLWTFTYHTDEDLEGMLETVTGPPADPNDPNAPDTLHVLGYSDRTLNNHWKTYYTDWQDADWEFWFDTGGRLARRIDPESNAFYVTHDSDNNPTSVGDDESDPIEAAWGAGGRLESLLTPSRASEDPNAAVWNEVTFVWDQPDPNGSPGFWRLGQSIDEDGFSTEFVYGDANDPTAASELWELSPGGDPNDPSVQPGSVSPFPTTGWGTHYRSYWRHAPFERSGWPMERAFERTEASAAPYTGGIETAVHQWRWRFHWIVPPFGAHVGIDYYHYGILRYLDYGEPPNTSACTCCVPGLFGASAIHVNNRYSHVWYRQQQDTLSAPRIVSRLDENEPPSSYSWGSYTPWNTADSTCMRSCFRWIAPLNYSDSSGECCRYFWNGWTPPTRTGDYSNSNGGSHTAFHRCVDECGGSWPHPPGWWTRFTPGWSNLDIIGNDNDECAGYDQRPNWN